MKYNVIKFVTNTSGAYQCAVDSTHSNLDSAVVKYHQLCATLRNAQDALTASVLITNEYGNKEGNYYELFDRSVNTVE